MIQDLYLSKSSVETFAQCQLKFSNRYIKKVNGIQKLADRQSAMFGTLIHTVLERYFADKSADLLSLYKEEYKNSEVNSHELFITGEQMIKDYARDSDGGNKILAMEQDFKLFLDNGVPVKGFIDRIDELSPEEIEIIDYKTGYSMPLTEKQLSFDLQLSIYTMAIKQLYPQYKKIKASLYYLHYGKVSVYISNENLESTKSYLSIVYDRMTKASELGEDLKPTVNSYCSFCDYKATCPAFQETIKTTEELSLTTSLNALIAPESGLAIDVEKLDLFLDMIVAKQKLLKKVEDEAKTFIKKYIETNGGEERKAKIGNTYYSLNSKKYTTYDPKIVLQLCREMGLDVFPLLSVSKAKVDETFKSNKEAMKKLTENARINFSEGYVR